MEGRGGNGRNSSLRIMMRYICGFESLHCETPWYEVGKFLIQSILLATYFQ